MMVYGLLAVTFLLSVLSIQVIGSKVGKSPILRWSKITMACSLALLVYLYGAWVFLSVYLKYIFVIVFLILGIRSGFRERRPRSRDLPYWLYLSWAGVNLCLAVFYFTGMSLPPSGVSLKFPLKGHRYIILQGGPGLPSNFFHYLYQGALYAVDLAKLNQYGNRCNQIFSKNLEDYEIYGDTVISPCFGKVIRMRDENPDNIPSVRKRGPSNINQVLIDADSFYVFLGHFGQHGVFVQEGAQVFPGQPLGLVGNSGFSLEPHLHLQVHGKTNSGLSWYEEKPLRIAFDGKACFLFEVWEPGRQTYRP
jgi:hypothetical protein